MAVLSLFAFVAPSIAQADASFEAIKTAAAAGDPAAQDKLAEKYTMRMDIDQATIWYRKAAAQGYARAQGRLADLLLHRVNRSAGADQSADTSSPYEGLKWATFAAKQGDLLGQANLAVAYSEGRFVKQDWIEAYKWGELASRVSTTNPAANNGRSIRDAAILHLTSDQLAEAKKQVAAFAPHQDLEATVEKPAPAWLKGVKLSGLAGSANHRLAIINNNTFEPGESDFVKVDGKRVSVKCLEVRENSVIVLIEGTDQATELTLPGN